MLRKIAEKLKWFARATWKGFLYFLDLIGLCENRQVDQERQLALFRLHHSEFRYLLTANNNFLETLADLEEKRSSNAYFDLFYVESKISKMSVDIHRMIETINTISGNRYIALNALDDRLVGEITRILERYKAIDPHQVVLDLSQVKADLVGICGGKVANLGEIKNVIGLPTPDGFVATSEGYRLFIRENGLESVIRDELAGLDSTRDVDKISGKLCALLTGTPVPDALANAIYEAYDRLAQRLHRAPLVAVRSSALGEDSHLSFAGQFLTILNVDRSGLTKAFVRVIASLFSPEALHYRLLHKIQYSTAMPVGFIEMVEALASGVILSKDPIRPDLERLLIHAVKGFGISLVSGYASPEMIEIQRAPELKFISRTASLQRTAFVSDPAAKIKEIELTGDGVTEIISEEEALALARWAVLVETHFGQPQDIEWAMDIHGPYLLQSRRVQMVQGLPGIQIEGLPVIIAGGDTVYPGVGVGPAFHLEANGDIDSFPEGAILVTLRSSPKFVRLMAKTKGILADLGSTTGHMASLAREFHIPTILNMHTATATIPQGAMITVDAANKKVYSGAIPADRIKTVEQKEVLVSDWVKSTLPYRLLEQIAPSVVPLNLLDPQSRQFVPVNCRTFHDIARFVHEKAYEEMFRQGEYMGDLRGVSYYLDVFVPIDLYVIDLGGGVSPEVTSHKIKPAHIISTPFKSMLKGILDTRLVKWGPKPMDMRGFFDIMMGHAMNPPEQERTFQSPCYALVSDNYLNYTARVGYHFGVVDSYCDKTVNKNYISLMFRGGAADIVRRGRRIRAIQGVLKNFGFMVEVNSDTLSASLKKAPREEIMKHLEMIGRLLQFFRQLDAAMVSEETVEFVKNAFLTDNFTFQ